MRNRLGISEWLLEAFGSWEARARGHRSPRPGQAHATTVFCFGESHTISLRRAWKRGLYRPHDPTLHFTFLLAGDRRLANSRIVTYSPSAGKNIIAPELESAIREYAGGSSETWFVSTWHSNAYNVYG